MQLKSVGIIGYGSFGKFIAVLLARFAPEISVRFSSSSHPADGKTFFSFEEVCAADAVVFCVPIHAFEATLIKALPLMPKTSVIVDVTTVKVYTTALLEKLAAGRPYLATHPLFGPQSYVKTEEKIDGYRIVFTEHTVPPEDYAALTNFLRTIGFTIVETTAEKHDEQLAESLFLTHFIGQSVNRAGFKRTEVDTISFEFLMQAVEIVCKNTEIFKDVFRFNPYCESVLKRLEAAEKDVHGLLQKEGRAPLA